MYIVHMCVSVCAHMHVSLQKNLCLVCSTQANMLHKFNLYILQIKLDINLKNIYTHIYTYTQYSNIYLHVFYMYMYVYVHIYIKFLFLV